MSVLVSTVHAYVCPCCSNATWLVLWVLFVIIWLWPCSNLLKCSIPINNTYYKQFPIKIAFHYLINKKQWTLDMLTILRSSSILKLRRPTVNNIIINIWKKTVINHFAIHICDKSSVTTWLVLIIALLFPIQPENVQAISKFH